MLLKDKVLIISGIGPGLGIKLAIEAAREGVQALALAARTVAKLDEAEAKVREISPNCKIIKVPTDIADAASCKNLVDKTVAAFGRVDGLVNSAFMHGGSGPIEG